MNASTPKISGGSNIALKVPTFQFGAMRLWLGFVTDEPEVAAEMFRAKGTPIRDEVT